MRTPALRDFTFTTVTVDPAGTVVDRPAKSGRFYAEDLGSVDLDMVAIEGGTFVMGTSEDEPGHTPMEGPRHEVTVPDFYISRFLVTQAQYVALIGHNPSQLQESNNPVECVTWHDATMFCQRLGDLTGRRYRLPTEAEWEYACRAGTSTPFSYGETLTDELANCYAEMPYAAARPGHHRPGPTPVGMYPANAFGLHDMHGNVFEWCADLLHNSFQGAPTDGRAWLGGGDCWPDYHVLRGASWVNSPPFCRSGFRFGNNPIYKSIAIGFRVAVSA